MEVHLPPSFAILTNEYLNFVYCLQKFGSQLCALRLSEEQGSIELIQHFPPVYGREVIAVNEDSIDIVFCIVPMRFCISDSYSLPVVLIKDFDRIQRFICVHSISINEVVPYNERLRARDLIKFLMQDLDSMPNTLFTGRRWTPGILPYPNQHEFNLDIESWRRQRVHLDTDEYENYGLPVRELPRQTPPTQSTRPSTSQESGPSKPSEKVATALARDYVAHGEICPITQEPLEPTEIGVTGCLCVFQGEALKKYEGSSCPSCRAPLVLRYINLTDKKEASNVSRTE